MHRVKTTFGSFSLRPQRAGVFAKAVSNLKKVLEQIIFEHDLCGYRVYCMSYARLETPRLREC